MSAIHSITARILNEKDWNLDLSDKTTLSVNCAFFYLVDFSLGEIRLVAINKADFIKLTETPRPRLRIEDSVGFISAWMKQFRKNKLEPTEADLSDLIQACCIYFSATQSFKMYQTLPPEAKELPNILINIYRKGSSDSSIIRPTIFRAEGLFASTSEVVSLARQIRAVDTNMHPENQIAVKDNLPFK
ncbi:hypothetical protein OCF84_21745 (plasmid) [Shewanella xiamenensis]|uniref:Uncharacterized protein n=1 Tax=Shewanella xiamenensis TaxID=332186 RepID=A0ABT6UEY5_9GAMM|nr:hypothetical protein [Shewanella xiamenensis]MDI5832497.1 hypothetical protein [Shewanella xiamenensis]WHF57884.1 hypothetical protein OCF84_21745 [Shewanella xiamenensis]